MGYKGRGRLDSTTAATCASKPPREACWRSPAGYANSGSEWEVQKVVDERKVRGNNEFLIRWHGFTEEDDTWEPEVQTHH